MGCANSKQKECSNCNNNSYSPVPRSYSMHVHHPPQSKGDSYHVVALTSTTLGSLDNGLRFSNGKVIDSESFKIQDKKEKKNEAKTWSDMIEEKLPKAMIHKTPIQTPSCEPETINTWELMEGLEDTSPFESPGHFRSFSFDVNVNGHFDPQKPSFKENNVIDDSPKAEISDFDDAKVVSSLQESMAEKGFFSSDEKEKISDDVAMDFETTSFGKDKVVFYFTSLRGVRKTYEDCCNVRLILKGLKVKIDERDVSMHSGFKEELKELLGHEYYKGGIGLPRVFIGRNYIGGAVEIQQLHEDGKLEKFLDCCEKIGDIDGEVCESCGDIRFVPCETCNGSCKIYYDDNEEDEENDEAGEYGFQRCPDCNENGLIRCPMCCY